MLQVFMIFGLFLLSYTVSLSVQCDLISILNMSLNQDFYVGTNMVVEDFSRMRRDADG